MSTSLHPSDRLADSQRKIRAPFELDPTLCIYSPQANLDALEHPRVKAWLEFLERRWQPPQKGSRRIALIIPCTKYKPYNTSREHRAINGALLRAGWEPEGKTTTPPELLAVLDAGESPELLHTGALVKDGVALDRIVMSEPLAMVPYTHIYKWKGEQSPATSYDDPGLFEARGTSVSPERADCSAVDLGNGKWRWGPNERAAFAEMHNRLVDVIAATLRRVGGRYEAIGAWVSPGLTHRSFLADATLRKAEGLPASKRGPDGPVALRGALDQIPGAVTVMPTQKQLDQAKTALAKRLAREGRQNTPNAVQGIYARGDGNDTPLGLHEALTHLTRWLNRMAK
ncbi:MAG TPA: hypothetical protein VLG28_13660 [Acidimicrobiia bacterium]|jgi:hypothetical protein|nr:hypothetical protein [Acidimicrobiia bacterium]